MFSSDFVGFHYENRCGRLLYVSAIGSHDIELTKLQQSSHYESRFKTGRRRREIGNSGFLWPNFYPSVIIVKTL